jgi:hypothetical protein
MYRQLVPPVGPRGRPTGGAIMPVQKKDFRTNRADYAIAAKSGADSDRDELLARKKMALWLRDKRSARLAANPSDSFPGPKARPRG